MQAISEDIGLYVDEWIRGRDTINTKRPSTYLVYGGRGTGKSSLLERIAVCYHEMQGSPIIDIYGARDAEALGWCRAKGVDRILFLTDSNIDVKSSFDSINISKLTLNDIENYDVVLTIPHFFSSTQHEYRGLAQIIDRIYYRQGWRVPWYCLIRESGNFIYSRLAQGENSALAKATFIRFLKEARHSGVAVGADALRPKSIDVDVREITDWLFIKALGNIELPDELWFLYSLIDPVYLATLPVNCYAVTSKNRAVGMGSFTMPKFHKQEDEHMLQILDIQIDEGEAPPLTLPKKRKITTEQHLKIVELRQKEPPDSFHSISLQLKISSATAHSEWFSHQNGQCDCFTKNRSNV